MEKTLANQIARLWNDKHSHYTDETATTAKVEKGIIRPLSFDVLIEPSGANDGMCFHQCRELIAIAHAFGVQTYISIRSGKCIGHIF